MPDKDGEASSAGIPGREVAEADGNAAASGGFAAACSSEAGISGAAEGISGGTDGAGAFASCAAGGGASLTTGREDGDVAGAGIGAAVGPFAIWS